METERAELKPSETPESVDPGEGVSGSGPIGESQPKEGPGPHAMAEALFERYAAGFQAWQLRDGARFLVNPSRVGRAVGMHLSPLESRHEQMVRALCTMVSSLAIRCRQLEAVVGEVLRRDPSLLAGPGHVDEQARSAASPGSDECAGESESSGLVRDPADSPVVDAQ